MPISPFLTGAFICAVWKNFGTPISFGIATKLLLCLCGFLLKIISTNSNILKYAWFSWINSKSKKILFIFNKVITKNTVRLISRYILNFIVKMQKIISMPKLKLRYLCDYTSKFIESTFKWKLDKHSFFSQNTFWFRSIFFKL